MSVFEITIQRKDGDDWPVVVRHQPGAQALAQWSRGRLDLDLARLEALRPTEKEYGILLGKALFREEIRDAFVRALSATSSGDEPLRVLLIVEADGLRDLHWEQLCAPLDRGWDYLLLNQATPFSLYLPSQIERRFPPNARALREARSKPNEVWRVLYRVTYVSRIPEQSKPTPVEAVPEEVRRPANIEANMGLIQEIERIKCLLPPSPEESHLVILGRAADRLLFGDASASGQGPSGLEQIVSWWEGRDEDVKREIRQDLMAYLKAYYESDLVAPETEGEEQRVTEGLQVALAE